MNKKLSWTKTPPKVEGYYWFGSHGEASIVYIHVPDTSAKPVKGEDWYGPLTPRQCRNG